MATTERNRNRESWRAVSEWSQSSRMNDLEARKPRPEPAPDGRPGSGVGLALDDLAGTLRAPPGAVRGLAPALGRLAAHPRASASAGQRLLASARRVTAAPATPS